MPPTDESYWETVRHATFHGVFQLWIVSERVISQTSHFLVDSYELYGPYFIDHSKP